MYACLCVLDKRRLRRTIYRTHTHDVCLYNSQSSIGTIHELHQSWQQQFQVLNCMVQTMIIYFTSYRQSSILHLPMYSNYCCHKLEMVYSKTSNSGPSEKRTTSLQRTAHLPPIDFIIELIHYKPPRSGHLSTPNNGHQSGPDVPWPI